MLAATALFIGLSCAPGAIAQDTTSSEASDAQIRALLIARSIQDYDGSCPCPYSRARNGSRCGKRSAWSRPGGASPLCYASDISEAMVKAERASTASSP